MKLFKPTLAYVTFFTILLSTVAQATTNLSSVNYNGKKGNHTLTLKQNYLSKKITLNSFNSKYTIEIFDTEGNLMKSSKIKKNSKLEISTADLHPGKYYLRYISKNKHNNSVKSIIIK